MTKFSIIIPTYNSEKYIQPCLDSIMNIDFPKKDYEIIVVDGRSKDRTLNILKKHKIKLIHSTNISIANSRNLAAKQAKADNLVFIDSDCVVNKNILKISENHLKKYSSCGSFYKPSKKARWIARTWLLIEKKKKGLVDWVPSGTLIVKKDAFKEIKGFNEKLKTGEDFDFCYRLKKKGNKIFNDPSIASIHLGQTDNFKEFFKKEMWRGNSLIKSIKQHGWLKEEFLSTSITLYHFSVLILLIIAVVFLPFKIMGITLVLLILPSFLLAIRKTIQSREITYLFNFYFLIITYQIARAISLIRYNQFKDLI